MAHHKIVHIEDILKCNHGGKVNLEPTEDRKSLIHEALRIVTDDDLLNKATITGCPNGCTKVTGIPIGLSKDFEVKGKTPVLRNIEADTDKGGKVKFVATDYDIGKAVAHLNSNAQPKSISRCARYVQNAIRAGGIKDLPGADAADFGPVLRNNGFEAVASSGNSAGYTPQTGDVVQFDAIPGHPYGHTAMWNGTQWVSDFKQRNLFVAKGYDKGTYTYYRIKHKGKTGYQGHAAPK